MLPLILSVEPVDERTLLTGVSVFGDDFADRPARALPVPLALAFGLRTDPAPGRQDSSSALPLPVFPDRDRTPADDAPRQDAVDFFFERVPADEEGSWAHSLATALCAAGSVQAHRAAG